jgi:monoamine oxidase
MGPFDVAIVGCGAAGLGAAGALRATGKNIMVLEAADHIGGRTFCDNTSFPAPFDFGGQWFHMVTRPSLRGGLGSNNPLYDIAKSRGLAVPSDLGCRVFMPTSPPQNVLGSALPVTLGLMAAAGLWAGGKAALFSHDPTHDISLAVATASLAGHARYDQCWGALITEHGAELDRVSCLDVFNLAMTATLPVITPSWDNHLIPSGMGNFIATFAEGVPVTLNTPVRSIAWGGKDGVTLDTPAGAVQARAAIVTVSVGVLSSGALAFNPSLPSEHQRALAGLEMGQTAKRSAFCLIMTYSWISEKTPSSWLHTIGARSRWSRRRPGARTWRSSSSVAPRSEKWKNGTLSSITPKNRSGKCSETRQRMQS